MGLPLGLPIFFLESLPSSDFGLRAGISKKYVDINTNIIEVLKIWIKYFFTKSINNSKKNEYRTQTVKFHSPKSVSKDFRERGGLQKVGGYLKTKSNTLLVNIGRKMKKMTFGDQKTTPKVRLLGI
jgi:hypothetical protein